MRQACFDGLCAPHPRQGHAPAGWASPSLDPAAGRGTGIALAYQLAAVIFGKSKNFKIFLKARKKTPPPGGVDTGYRVHGKTGIACFRL